MKKLVMIMIGVFPIACLMAQVGICVAPDGRIKELIDYGIEPEAEAVLTETPATKRQFYYVPIEVDIANDAEDIELARLAGLDEVDINIRGGELSSAIKLCANACEMNYIAPPAGSPFDQTISLRVRSNPYQVLQLLCDTYHVGLDFREGIWQFHRINLSELITKTYRLRFNNQEQFSIAPPHVNASISKAGAADSGISAGSTDVFAVETDVIVKEIQKLLDLPTTGLQAVMDTEGIDSPKRSSLKVEPAPKGSVIYNSDNNELIVVATRQQHSYIEQYLAVIDKPQPLIEIKALLVETSRNPKSDFGIDWSGVSGTSVGLTDITTGPLDMSKSLSRSLWPTATLSGSDMAITMNFIHTDSESSIVQSPRVVTTNNREVALKSVIQQPIESGNNVDASFASRSNTSTIDYIEIGTIINIYPKIIDDNYDKTGKRSVQLNVSLVVSSEIGKQIINRREYPVISSRTYNYSVIVPAGHTLAIGGLSESQEMKVEKRVSLLSKLPVIGLLAQNKSNTKKNRDLVAYITPTILE